MKQSIYLTTHGILARKDNTLLYINEDQKTTIPYVQVRDIHAFGNISVRSGVVSLLADNNIPLHHYNQYQMHISSLMPRNDQTSGKLIVEQVKSYLDADKRLSIAQAIVSAIRSNMVHNLEYYQRKGKEVSDYIERINGIELDVTRINELLGLEANIWKIYYASFDVICPELPFEYRSYHPPHNEMNSLLSLTNMMTYTTVLSMISQTYLHPSVSYLHEPRERRYSLSLDLAEYFKPIIGHRVIFNLVNKRQITKDSFEQDHGIKLSKKAFKVVLTAFQDRLNHTFRNDKLKRKISIREQIKMDAYKLIKVILEDIPFEPYVM